VPWLEDDPEGFRPGQGCNWIDAPEVVAPPGICDRWEPNEYDAECEPEDG